MRSILRKHQALGIRQIAVDIERHPLRDSGMVQSGAQLTRMKKGYYHKALLMWDHHGSGRDHKQAPAAVQDEIQRDLDAYTWKDKSAVIILVPELEQWIWYCESALLNHCGITNEQLQGFVDAYARKMSKSPDELKAEQPKELFEYVLRDRLKRTISPRDFEEIGSRAGIQGLMACDSFQAIVDRLRAWFPL
ncbi:methylation-associated defense system protein MAD4 [Halochromatium salexigens]|uniref:DUF4276 family protein n=1 Tax=Halochromatium salexigens TaxID=49447 RepID=A0AAJ0UIG6_HALSE|nr:hypothetical protein [Halochromatium salexigens]MBK5931883.1 hypothetical protein [Halochromatium salexigens]